MDKRIITTDVTEEDFSLEGNLRPQTLDDYIGQEKTKSTLKVYIEAAKQRHDALDHVLFYGPPGLGKTTLSNIISNEMNSNIKITSGPAIEKPGDLAALLTNLNEYDVLFIDEIHRLNKSVEEILYPALEDFTLDIIFEPSFDLISSSICMFKLSGILSSGTSIILHIQNLDSLFEYSLIASLKNFSLIFPTQIIFIFNKLFLHFL